jgi:hypothetical protein
MVGAERRKGKEEEVRSVFWKFRILITYYKL